MTRPRLRSFARLALGLLVGLGVGAVRASWGPAYQYSTARTLSQRQFERGVTATPQAGFRVSALVVHPPEADGVQWVTGTYREQGPRGMRTGPFKYRAATPYRPRLAMDGGPDGLTVRRYLDEIARRVPQAALSYRYAWSETPAAGLALWGAIGLAGGTAWVLVRRLTGDIPAEPTADAAPSESPAPPVVEPVTPVPPEPVAPPSPPVQKHFGGEFYPTEVHADER